jgi:hypothetical protein
MPVLTCHGGIVMSRIWKLGTLLLVIGALAAPAAADDTVPVTAGHNGTVTAWTTDGDKVLAHKLCPRFGSSWDYLKCGRALREQLQTELCVAKGPGEHKYLYQVGDGRKNPSSVYCKK